MNSKILNTRIDRFSQYSDENDIYDDSVESTRLSPYEYPTALGSPTSSTPSSPSYMTVSPPRHHRSLPSSFSREGGQRISLPPISTLEHAARRPSFHHSRSSGAPSANGSTSYAPLSPEDRRVLDRFRVIL